LLTPKEISQRFEVQLNTLYNWRKTKPKLFAYLQNADYNYQRSNEINVLLDFYSKDIQKNFIKDEIYFIVDSDFEVNSIEEVENIEALFIKYNYKLLPTKNEFILSIYNKLKELNIIEKYIFYKKIYKYRQNKELIVDEFFKEFLERD
jgi:hypothetical protein